MSKQPCPRGDGTCVIPDNTLVAQDGVISVRSRRDIEADFGPIDLSLRSLESFDQLTSMDTLTDAFENAESSRQWLAAFSETERDSLERELASDAESDTTVLVYCSPCGHVFKTRL